MYPEEPIWREDVKDHGEYAKDVTKVFHKMVETLQRQGAPPDLIVRLVRLRDLSAQICDELEELEARFPSQP
jgi:hypothetical protein